MQAVARVSMETHKEIENTPWRGPAETLVPLKSKVLLTDSAFFFLGLFLSASQIKLK